MQYCSTRTRPGDRDGVVRLLGERGARSEADERRDVARGGGERGGDDLQYELGSAGARPTRASSAIPQFDSKSGALSGSASSAKRVGDARSKDAGDAGVAVEPKAPPDVGEDAMASNVGPQASGLCSAASTKLPRLGVLAEECLLFHGEPPASCEGRGG